ncbi:uncharacterized protein LOC141651469 [Silene latifolia]|uniref:uncharacterized protein LOC141651469 n=1 Tax=Silene latifolia TaxID=37657 RepID=UPI003D77EB6E
MKVAAWNVRGFNNPIKHSEVMNYIYENKLDLIALLETRVKQPNRRQSIFLRNILMEAQVISCLVRHFETNTDISLSFVYGSNDAAQREDLWDSLRSVASPNPWMVLADFNVVRCPEEKLSSNPPLLHEMLEFNSCVFYCHLDDISSSGCDMTWTNKQEPGARVWSKLDRVLVNASWISSFLGSHAIFHEAGISDHSPILVFISEDKKILKRFSFLNSWVEHPDFLTTVQNAWFSPIAGSPMFCLFKKLKFVKHALSKLHNKAFSNVSIRRAKLKNIQLSDSGSKYFFDKISERQHHQVLGAICDHTGVMQQGLDNVGVAFQGYYQSLLGEAKYVAGLDTVLIPSGPKISEEDTVGLIQAVSIEEIRDAVFSMDSNSSHGVDGFSAGFFKSAWSIVGGDLCRAVQSFFRTGKMAKQAN